MRENEISRQIIQPAVEVHRRMVAPAYLLEIAYEEAWARNLNQIGLTHPVFTLRLCTFASLR